jgi:hypothetical protein
MEKLKKRKLQHEDNDTSNKCAKTEIIHFSDDSETSILPECKYGSDCYRKNPVHLAEFSHLNAPKLTESCNSTQKNQTKKLFYLTKIHNVKNQKLINEKNSISLSGNFK